MFNRGSYCDVGLPGTNHSMNMFKYQCIIGATVENPNSAYLNEFIGYRVVWVSGL